MWTLFGNGRPKLATTNLEAGVSSARHQPLIPFSVNGGLTLDPRVLERSGPLYVHFAAASTIQTGDEVGIRRNKASPDAASNSPNSACVRSRALPNIAIICVSTR